MAVRAGGRGRGRGPCAAVQGAHVLLCRCTSSRCGYGGGCSVTATRCMLSAPRIPPDSTRPVESAAQSRGLVIAAVHAFALGSIFLWCRPFSLRQCKIDVLLGVAWLFADVVSTDRHPLNICAGLGYIHYMIYNSKASCLASRTHQYCKLYAPVLQAIRTSTGDRVFFAWAEYLVHGVWCVATCMNSCFTHRLVINIAHATATAPRL